MGEEINAKDVVVDPPREELSPSNVAAVLEDLGKKIRALEKLVAAKHPPFDTGTNNAPSRRRS
jgi:hypothetical protein